MPRPRRGELKEARETARGINPGALYIGVLIGGDRYELRLREGEGLHSARLVGILRPVFVHLHHMQAWLVLVEGLQNHHLSGRGKAGRGPREEEQIRARRMGSVMPAGNGTPLPPPRAACGSPRPRRARTGDALRIRETRGKINGRTPPPPPFTVT